MSAKVFDWLRIREGNTDSTNLIDSNVAVVQGRAYSSVLWTTNQNASG